MGCAEPLRILKSGLPRPRTPGYFFLAGKVPKRAPGRPWTPSFCLIGHYQGRCPVATEMPLCLRFPRNWCGGYLTLPDGPRANRCFLVCSNRYIYPFKPVGPYLLTPPAADSNEDRASAEARRENRRRSDAKRSRFSGCAVAASIPTGWTNNGVRGVPGGVLVTLPPRAKYPRGTGARSPWRIAPWVRGRSPRQIAPGDRGWKPR